jgi:hypothetical protein
MKKLIEQLLKLAVVATLIYGLFTEQHYYSLFLRWLIFVSSIYFAYKAKQEIWIIGIISFCAFAILFNPFIDFAFGETTWRIIDLIVIVFIASNFEWKQFLESLSPKDKLRFILIQHCFWGLVILIASFWLVFSATGNPYQEYLLITKGTNARGFITDADEEIQENDAGGNTYYYYYSYYFKLPDGKKVQSYQKTSGGFRTTLPDLSKPFPVKVVYLANRPEINKIKNTLCQSVGEFIWRKLGLGILLLLILSSIGFELIRRGIKSYLIENQKN